MSAGVARETVPAAPRMDVSRETARATAHPGILATVVLLPIRAYRRFLSPLLTSRCRYYPSCSTYAEQSIRELGAVRGSIVAAWRVLRCNPFSNGGLDPVSDRRLFRSSHECSGEVGSA